VTERSKERTSRPRAKTHLALMEQRIVEALTERIRDVETRLLTEFHKWASPVEMRTRSHPSDPPPADPAR
jgi:hypothetical protein